MAKSREDFDAWARELDRLADEAPAEKIAEEKKSAWEYLEAAERIYKTIEARFKINQEDATQASANLNQKNFEYLRLRFAKVRELLEMQKQILANAKKSAEVMAPERIEEILRNLEKDLESHPLY